MEGTHDRSVRQRGKRNATQITAAIHTILVHTPSTRPTIHRRCSPIPWHLKSEVSVVSHSEPGACLNINHFFCFRFALGASLGNR